MQLQFFGWHKIYDQNNNCHITDEEANVSGYYRVRTESIILASLRKAIILEFLEIR